MLFETETNAFLSSMEHGVANYSIRPGGGGGGDLDLYHMNEFIKNKFEESFYELL